jgi:hypothetical protein
VQEAYLRAFRFFDSFQGGDDKSWLLAFNPTGACRECAGFAEIAAA